MLKVEFVKREVDGKVTTTCYLNYNGRRINKLNMNYTDLQVINGLIEESDYSFE